jgi:hypothetical protein
MKTVGRPLIALTIAVSTFLMVIPASGQSRESDEKADAVARKFDANARNRPSLIATAKG